MPEPVPTPIEGEILTASEIMMVSYEDAETAVSADSAQAVSDAKWAATLVDIAAWTTGGVGSNAGDVKRIDQIEFFEGSNVDARLDMRNKVRLRYGFPFMTSEAAQAAGAGLSSLNWINDCYGRI